MPHMSTLNDLNHLYQKDLLSSSHGEAYLDFFKSRLRKNELYRIFETILSCRLSSFKVFVVGTDLLRSKFRLQFVLAY